MIDVCGHHEQKGSRHSEVNARNAVNIFWHSPMNVLIRFVHSEIHDTPGNASLWISVGEALNLSAESGVAPRRYAAKS